MPSQQELLKSAKAIDDRINNSREIVKQHKAKKPSQGAKAVSKPPAPIKEPLAGAGNGKLI